MKTPLEKLKILSEAFNIDKPTRAEVISFFNTLTRAVQEAIAQAKKSLEDKIDVRIATLKDGRDGKDGKDGKTGPQGIHGIDGDDGKDGRDGKDGLDGSPDTPEEIATKLNTLEGVVDKSVIRGLSEIQKEVRDMRPRGMFIGPSRGHFLYIDGVKKGLVNTVNIIAGSGISLTYNTASGRNDITISASAISSVVLDATGTVNGSNTVFTFISAPTFIVADGVFTRATDTSGNVNWTIVGTTVTMTNAPSLDIYGIA